MPILVTGGAGYIGSHIVKLLSETGHEVIVYDNLSTGSADAFLHKEKLVVADLADQSKLEEVFSKHKISAVIHMAASIIVPESVAQPLQYYRNNTLNTLNLIQSCERHGINKIVFSSTAAVYGESPTGIVDEATPTQPTSPYGASKLMSERILQDAAIAHDIQHVTLRYFNVAGADPQSRIGQRNPQATHLIKMCCQAALRQRKQVEIYGTDYPTPDGTGIRDYIHVEDLAHAHLAALQHLEKSKSSLTLNVGYGNGSSVRDVIKTIKAVAKIDFPVVEVARRAGDLPKVVANADRIKQVLNWQPQHEDLNKIIHDAWLWEKKLYEH